MDSISAIARMEYEQSFDPHYEDEEEKQEERDPFTLADEWFDEHYDEEERGE